jgi:hypothetical protein
MTSTRAACAADISAAATAAMPTTTIYTPSDKTRIGQDSEQPACGFENRSRAKLPATNQLTGRGDCERPDMRFSESRRRR